MPAADPVSYLPNHDDFLDRKHAFEREEIDAILGVEDCVEFYSHEKNFRGLLNIASDLGVSFSAMADQLTTSKANVSRWAGGKSLPPRHGRVGIVLGVIELLKAKRTA